MASFNPNELEILKVLWEEGSLKPSEIQEKLSQPVKNSALRWQLASLMEKGYVTRRKKGKAYFYRATTPRRSVLKRLTRSMATIFAGGSAVALVGEILESEEKLSEEDVRELRRIAEKKATSPQTAEQRRRQK